MAVWVGAACGGGGSVEPEIDASPPDAPGEPLALTIRLLDGDTEDTSNGDFVALRDGSGAWTPLTGDAGVYAATVHGRYGIFIGCDEPQRTTFYFRHPDDGAEVELPSCATRGSLGDTVTVSGALTGADENAFVDVFVGGDFADTTDIAYTGVAPAGQVEVMAVEWSFDTFAPSRMLRHDLGVLADDATLDLVFDDAIAPAQADNEVIGIDPAEELQISVSVHRGDAQVGSWFEFIDPGVLTFTTLPGALREADDTLAVDHFANLDRGATTRTRSLRRPTVDVDGPLTGSLPPPLDFEAPSTDTSGGLQLSFELPDLALATGETLMAYAYTTTDGYRDWTAIATARWANGAAALEFGSLAGFAGWSPAWEVTADGAWGVNVSSADGLTSAGTYGEFGDAAARSAADRRRQADLHRRATATALGWR